MNKTTTHPFTRSGMGPAPFRFDGMASIPGPSLAEANPTAYNNALASLPRDLKGGCGTCYHCGMGIMNIYIVRNADGERFGVGCDCIEKMDADLELLEEVREARRAHERARRAKREELKRQARLAELAGSSIFTFGKHSGKTAEEVDREDPDYLTWALDSNALSDHETLLKHALATDTGREWQDAKDRAKREREEATARFKPLADLLADGCGGFCDSIAEGLRNGQAPIGRGLEATCDILAKMHGRRGSKDFLARWDEVWEVLTGSPAED